MLTDILVPIAVFATTFGIFYIFFTTRNRERLALIEKSADASILYSKKNKNGNTVLKYGLLLIGLGIGILMGYVATLFSMIEQVAYPAMILLFGGLGLIAYYLIMKNKKSEE
ncbi:MAG: hypothetical protein KAT68_10165 [Bacteroidales bacterium]|nr:hypothetical protein [Bacteroidales bacterium]